LCDRREIQRRSRQSQLQKSTPSHKQTRSRLRTGTALPYSELKLHHCPSFHGLHFSACSQRSRKSSQARMSIVLALLSLSFISTLAFTGGPVCPVNASYFPPLTCPDSYSCCKMPATAVCAEEAPPCTVCAECCHALNATQCSTCVATMCTGRSTIGDYGCNTTQPQTWVPWIESCCGRGVPLPASTTLPNCLLIGDSVTSGLSSVAIDLLKDVCQTQLYEGVDAAYEAACWGTHRVVRRCLLPSPGAVVLAAYPPASLCRLRTAPRSTGTSLSSTRACTPCGRASTRQTS
jgi:hypothetical protein